MTPVIPPTRLFLNNNVVSFSVICDDREGALRLHHQLRADVKNIGAKHLHVDFHAVVVEWDQIVGENG